MHQPINTVSSTTNRFFTAFGKEVSPVRSTMPLITCSKNGLHNSSGISNQTTHSWQEWIDGELPQHCEIIVVEADAVHLSEVRKHVLWNVFEAYTIHVEGHNTWQFFEHVICELKVTVVAYTEDTQ
ncbi:hypothetical protein E2C01_032137 [Portunus trituberculatus]|uniref:Uncharacterized protein n=1 Tax=Portunus trituberculatus TaxID=210409 RepID=A0A5B7EZJ6_PORTR|nr:hypothetical protein [Portunus trituberculatus]